MDIHNYRRRLYRVLKRINDFNIPEENKKAITDFVIYNKRKDLNNLLFNYPAVIKCIQVG
jgi:hypothetical protein